MSLSKNEIMVLLPREYGGLSEKIKGDIEGYEYARRATRNSNSGNLRAVGVRIFRR